MSQERALQVTQSHAHGIKRGRMKRPFALKYRPASFSGYDEVIRHILQKAGGKGMHPAHARIMESHLHSISDSLERLRYVGNKKGALIIISEIAFCYPNPLFITNCFSSSYSIMAEMAVAVSEGRHRRATGGDAARAEECRRKAEALNSVMGLRQIRFNAATAGPMGMSSYEIPLVTERDLVGSVNFGRAVERGRRNDFRRPRPINLVRLEPRLKYELTIAHLAQKMLPLVGRANVPLAETRLTEIAESMRFFQLEGNHKKALCSIVETCLLYEDPMRILESFCHAYSLMAQIAADMMGGRRQPVARGCEWDAEDFRDRLMRFTSLSGLVEMRRNAAIASNGSSSTYQIPFITSKQLEDIAAGKVKSHWGGFRC